MLLIVVTAFSMLLALVGIIAIGNSSGPTAMQIASTAPSTTPAACASTATTPGPIPTSPPWLQPSLGSSQPVNARKAQMDTRYDFLLYGDSITQLLQNSKMWSKHFGKMKAEPLGVGGDDVEQLVWRLLVGKEKPKHDPRVVAFLIGTNNRSKNPPADKVDYMLQWVKAAMPTSRIILLNILPRLAVPQVPTWNAQYQELAAKHGVRFSTCGRDISTSKDLDKSKVHLKPSGYDKLLSCLRREVDEELKKC